MDEKLPRRVRYWLSDAQHDCFFVVGPENGPTERIGAMKTLLMGDSEPFRAMLQDSEMAEKGDIRVTDVDPESFRNFLKCVYGGSSVIIPNLTFEECAKLLYITEKYLISDLKDEVSKRMKTLFSYKDIFVALSHPICHQNIFLKDKILQFIKYDFNKITADNSFCNLNEFSISWILQQNNINVREIEIWNAVLQWAKNKTDSQNGKVLRSYIFDLLKYFRFLTMDFKEFWEGVLTSEILLEEEVSDICKAFVSGGPCGIEYLCKERNNRYNIFLPSKNIVSSFMEYPKYAFMRCLVHSISDLQRNVFLYSNTYRWAELLMCLLVEREMFEGEEHLSVFVFVRGQMLNWNCEVDVEISLINNSGKPDYSIKCSKTFSPSLRYWGFPTFYEWSSLLNPDNGFVKDNSIILLTRIQLCNT